MWESFQNFNIQVVKEVCSFFDTQQGVLQLTQSHLEAFILPFITIMHREM